MNGFNRGNAVPETALAVSFTLLVLFGLTQFATTTFYQVSADGASFVGAHDAVASDGSPTSANQQDAVTAASAAFSKIVGNSVSVLNPSNSTFETDISQQVPGISALGNPTALTVNSRIVEETAGTASSSQLPPSAEDCTQTAENIVNAGNSGGLATVTPIVNQAVGVTQATQTIVSTSINGTTTLSLNPAPVVNELSALNGIETDITQTVATLNALPATLNSTIGMVPGASGLVSAIETAVSNSVQPAVSSALTGEFTAAEQAASVVAVNAAIKNVPGVGTVLYNLLVPVVDAALTGGSAGTGLLGLNGPLTLLSESENGLTKLMDTKLPTCPSTVTGS